MSRPSPGAWSSRVIDPQLDGVTIRPARLDRPLRKTTIDSTFTDPYLEELVRAAADQARQDARAEGYAAGWSDGRQAAAVRAEAESVFQAKQAAAERAAVSRQAAHLLAALADATRSAGTSVAPQWTEVSDTLADGAMRLATAILGRELRSIDNAVAASVKAALALLAEPDEAVVHLNPEDAALVLDDDTLSVRVISDPRVPVGGMLALTPAQRLRHDLTDALDAAEAVLRS
jgi:flagellar assembly protein FliH